MSGLLALVENSFPDLRCINVDYKGMMELPEVKKTLENIAEQKFLENALTLFETHPIVAVSYQLPHKTKFLFEVTKKGETYDAILYERVGGKRIEQFGIYGMEKKP